MLADHETFIQNLVLYARYKALDAVKAKRESFSAHARPQLDERLERYRPNVETSFAYLDTLDEEALREQFEFIAQSTQYYTDLFDQPEELRQHKVEAVGFPLHQLAVWWLEDYAAYKAARGEPTGSSRTRRRAQAAYTEFISVHSSTPVFDIGETIARGVFTLSEGQAFPTAAILGNTSGRIELLPFWDHARNQAITPQHIGLVQSTNEREFERLQEQALDMATSYNEEMATYFYAMDAYWLMNARDTDDYVDLRIDDLLQYTGKRPVKSHGRYTGAFRPDQIQRAGLMVYGMGFSMVEIDHTVIKGVGARTHYKRLWDVTDMYVMRTLDDQTYIESLRYRPNEFFREASFGGRREAALLMSKVLGLDYDKMVIARRLGRYYTWIWRDRARGGQIDAPIACGRLLERTGIELTAGRERYARRTLETALDRLETEGIIAQWTLRNPDGSPADTAARISFKRWLRMKISVMPPDSILTHYAAGLAKAGAQGQIPQGKLDVERLRRRRLAAGLTLSQLAELVGVDVSTLSRIEAGKTRRPRQEALEKLSKWMDDAAAAPEAP